jgi:Fe2+ transport system protein FeoA
MTTEDIYSLEQARVGDRVIVKHISNDETATQAMRLGISEGETLEVASKVPGGPLVIRRGKLEIALGRDLCRSIEVERQT